MRDLGHATTPRRELTCQLGRQLVGVVWGGDRGLSFTESTLFTLQ